MMETQGFPNAEMKDSHIKMVKGLKHAYPLAASIIQVSS